MTRSIVFVALVVFTSQTPAQDPAVIDAIRREATRSERSDVGRPLPLAAHWNSTGMYREGFTAAYQLEQIKQGRHLLPWMEWPITDRDLARTFKDGDPRRAKY